MNIIITFLFSEEDQEVRYSKIVYFWNFWSNDFQPPETTDLKAHQYFT